MGNIKRQSIRLGTPVLELFETGAFTAPTMGKRIDLLASRFQQLLAGSKPPAWSADNWITFFWLAGQTDLTQPGAIYSLQGNAKALGESRLGYAFDSLAQAQHVLLIVLAEKFIHQYGTGKPTQEEVEAFAEAQGFNLPGTPSRA